MAGIHPAHHANEIRRLKDVISKITRERDALQQQNYDLAARVAHLEKELDRELEHSTEVIHSLHCQLDVARARLDG